MFDSADRLVARSVADCFLELRVEDADGEVVSSFHLFDRIDEFLFQSVRYIEQDTHRLIDVCKTSFDYRSYRKDKEGVHLLFYFDLTLPLLLILLVNELLLKSLSFMRLLF